MCVHFSQQKGGKRRLYCTKKCGSRCFFHLVLTGRKLTLNLKCDKYSEFQFEFKCEFEYGLESKFKSEVKCELELESLSSLW